VLAGARREALEETGLHDMEQIVLLGDPSMPLVIDSHYIPANPSKDEPEHYHHDYRYLFVARSTDVTPQLLEVRAVEWVPLGDERAKKIGAGLERLQSLGLV
jgi:8-oxo-dGTP pyrophosphatase MutT (NUDIX family)